MPHKPVLVSIIGNGGNRRYSIASDPAVVESGFDGEILFVLIGNTRNCRFSPGSDILPIDSAPASPHPPVVDVENDRILKLRWLNTASHPTHKHWYRAVLSIVDASGSAIDPDHSHSVAFTHQPVIRNDEVP